MIPRRKYYEVPGFLQKKEPDYRTAYLQAIRALRVESQRHPNPAMRVSIGAECDRITNLLNYSEET